MHKLKINESSYRFIIAGGLVWAAMLLAALALPISPAHAAGRLDVPAFTDLKLHDICDGPDDPNVEQLDMNRPFRLQPPVA